MLIANIYITISNNRLGNYYTKYRIKVIVFTLNYVY